jgi:hypothetical protein
MCVMVLVRSARAKQHEVRLNALFDAWNHDERSVSPGQIEQLLTEFREGLVRIATAQKRERCVFASGITHDALLPHAQVLRLVVKLLRMKTSLDLSRLRPVLLRGAMRFPGGTYYGPSFIYVAFMQHSSCCFYAAFFLLLLFIIPGF